MLIVKLDNTSSRSRTIKALSYIKETKNTRGTEVTKSTSGINEVSTSYGDAIINSGNQ